MEQAAAILHELGYDASHPGIVFGTTAADLVQMFEPEVNAVVITQAWNAADTASLGERRLQFTELIDPEHGGDVLLERLSSFPVLCEFSKHWIDVLAELSGCPKVGLRIATVTQAMCPRFHVDHVTVRFVCALDGSGTELLDNQACDRRYLGVPTSHEGEPEGMLRRGARVFCAPPGAMVCLKGELWPGNRGKGAVHRSPPASSERPRLVMTLDPLE